MFFSDAFQYTRFSRRVFTLSGEVINTLTGPQTEISIDYQINGESASVLTNCNGRYFIRAREGDHVCIEPSFGICASAQTDRYVICCVCSDDFDLDFILDPVMPCSARISGTLIGDTPLVGDAAVSYTYNGTPGIARTDADGNYVFSVPLGADVVITPPAIAGFTAYPTSIELNRVPEDISGQNFTYTATLV